MFDKWKRNGCENVVTLPSPPLSSSSSSPNSSSSSLSESPTHPKRYIALLKKWFTPRFIQNNEHGMYHSTPDPRCRSQYRSEQRTHRYDEQSYIQQYQHQQKQKHRWSIDMVQEYLTSPPPRRFTLKFPPPACGGTFLSTIPEI